MNYSLNYNLVYRTALATQCLLINQVGSPAGRKLNISPYSTEGYGSVGSGHKPNECSLFCNVFYKSVYHTFITALLAFKQ